MSSMFNGATSFNQDLTSWDVSNVTNMSNMFHNSTSFDRNLAAWDISSVTNIVNILDYTGMSVTNYNSTLNGWALETVNSSLLFAGYGLIYSPNGKTGHDTLKDTYLWSFYGDAYVSEDIIKTNTDYTFTINAFSDFSSGDYQLYYNSKYSSTVTYDNQVDTTIQFTINFSSSGIRLPIVLKNITSNSDITTYYLDVYPNDIACFKEDTKILTNNGYIPIQDLRKGDLIKTLRDDYKPIVMIGKIEIYHSASQERIKNQLYKCSQSEYHEIFEPLIITGCHSILVDNFINEEEREKTIEVNGEIYVTNKKYRLPACVDHRFSIYELPGIYTIYHFALENDNYYNNYGIYANGLLVETCSKRYLKELSNMNFIE